jgi:hypothetical protein
VLVTLLDSDLDSSASDTNGQQRWAKHALAFMFSARGFVDATVRYVKDDR